MLGQVDHPAPAAAMPAGPAALARSGIPLYIQVAGLLRRRLESGAWRLGDRIPAIEALMEEYQVSRVTMRQALAELEGEKLVLRSQGKGTIVTRDATQERWLILPTEWDALIHHIEALDSRAEPLESGSGMPPAGVGDDGLAQEYWHTRRVNFTGATPYSLTSIYLERSVYERDAAAFASGPILPLLARRLRRNMGRAVQRLAVSTADVQTAHHLQVPVGTPIVEVMRIVWNRAGRMVYVADVRYHARHLRIETVLYPPAGQPTAKTAK